MTDGYMIFGMQKQLLAVDTPRYFSTISTLDTSEALVRVPICGNTAKKLFVKVYAFNLIDVFTDPLVVTVTVRKNGVNTALTLTFSAVGTYSVTADVAFADGDELSFVVDAAGTRQSGSCSFSAGVGFLSP